MKAIIVDDEKPSRIILQKLIEWHCPQLELVSMCKSVDEAVVAINEKSPDLVFLDIAMPKKNGFDLFKELDEINFEVIFITAYDEFAIDAFKVHASAYLLKPVDKDLLIASVQNIEKKGGKKSDYKKLELMVQQLSQMNQRTGKIAIPTMEGIEYIKTDTIIKCLAEGNYTRIYMIENQEIYISKSIKQVEVLLDNYNFIRPHNSHLVNVEFIKKYVKGSGGHLILDDGSTIPVSRQRKSVVNNLI